MNNHPSPEAWLREVLVEGWGDRFWESCVQPLGPAGETVTHTAAVWRVDIAGEVFVAKVLLDNAFARASPFHLLKRRVMEHCRSLGVPVAVPILTGSGAPSLEKTNRCVEVSRYVADASPWGSEASQDRVVGDAIFDLRVALDTVSNDVAEAIEPIALPPVVEEVDVVRAFAEGVDALLSEAVGGHGPWARTAEEALRPFTTLTVEEVKNLVEKPISRKGIIHGDLHREHVLLLAGTPPRVGAILDFDNMRLGDRNLDLAWLLDQCAVGKPQGPDVDICSVLKRAQSALDRGIVSRAEIPTLMFGLVEYAIPIIVDIAKDILRRGLRFPIWSRYLSILDLGRKLKVHSALVENFS